DTHCAIRGWCQRVRVNRGYIRSPTGDPIRPDTVNLCMPLPKKIVTSPWGTKSLHFAIQIQKFEGLVAVTVPFKIERTSQFIKISILTQANIAIFAALSPLNSS